MTQREVEGIVEEYKKSIPVKVVALARELGLGVKKTKQRDDSRSGAIVRNSGGSYTIWTSARHPWTRRRFTVAHETAHFVLHRDSIGDGIHDDALFRSNLGGIMELQANRFAASLLMPLDLVNQCIRNGADSIEKLANALRVSKAAMSIRLGIPWE